MPEVSARDIVTGAAVTGGAVVLYQVGKRLGWWGSTAQDETPYTPESGSPPATLNDAAARAIADRIYSAIYGDGTWWSGNAFEDEAAVIRALDEPQNDNDVIKVINAYGVRTGGFAQTGPLHLVGVVQEYLSASDIATINSNFSRKGITMRF